MSLSKLTIRHEGGRSGPFRFCVERLGPDGLERTASVTIDDPLSQPLGDTDLRLGPELAWYLESYLDYPFGPNGERAERLTQALRAWGEKCFAALFGEGRAQQFYRDAVREGHQFLQIVLASGGAPVLAWPWEALYDPSIGELAQHCLIERQIGEAAELQTSRARPLKDRIRILLVTARPFAADINYRSVSRPLIELISSEGLPAEVTLLRPPTLSALQAELEAHPGVYDIVHFDGHGGLAPPTSGGAAVGQLLFETIDGDADPIAGEQLGEMLGGYDVPIVVLNACRSAMFGSDVDDAFASVSTSLLRAGVRSVVGMGYGLYVRAAQIFLPAFYRRLFQSGSAAEAVRAGRQAMLADPERLRGMPLQDFIVPVLYQQAPQPLSFGAPGDARAGGLGEEPLETAVLSTAAAPYGLIGRDSFVLALERASRRAPAAMLVHGLGGVGKTALAHGYMDWLAQTKAAQQQPIWLSFEGIRSADQVFSRLIEAVLGFKALAEPLAQALAALVAALREHPRLIVWDNFETASGAQNGLSDSDREALRRWLEQLRGGRSKVLITSRGEEAWLGSADCWRIPLGGLQGEERWGLAQAILDDQGLVPKLQDQAIADLVDRLEGHPLMMRVVLPRLSQQSPEQLLEALATHLPDADSDDPMERQLYATLRLAEDVLPGQLRPLLYLVSLHEEYVDVDYLEAMASEGRQPFDRSNILEMLDQLEHSGLVREIASSVFQLHPALTRYLRLRAGEIVADVVAVEGWNYGFVLTMAHLANHYGPKSEREQDVFYSQCGASMLQALHLADHLGIADAYTAILQAQAIYAQNRHLLSLAKTYYEDMVRRCEARGQLKFVAVASHQLGMIAHEQRDFVAAEHWFRKSLDYSLAHGHVRGSALTFHELGRLAQERRDFTAAEAWYRQSLGLKEAHGDRVGAASTYHQMGLVAAERREFASAETWFLKAVEISEQHGDWLAAADTHQQLGATLRRQGDLAGARHWYGKALEIRQRFDDTAGAAGLFYQVALIAIEERDFAEAEGLLRHALRSALDRGDDVATAANYHQLGTIAEILRDFDIAKAWYQQALQLERARGDDEAAGSTLNQLGVVAIEQMDFAAAQEYLTEAHHIFEETTDDYRRTVVEQSLARLKSVSGATALSPQARPGIHKEPPIVFDAAGPLSNFGRAPRVNMAENAEYTVWYATSRRPVDPASPLHGFTCEHDDRLHYGSCQVFVPKSHKIGSIGSPWWKRMQTMTDDRLKLMSVTGLPEDAFWASLARQLDACVVEERDAVVFVHGFNVTFEEAAIRAAQIGFDLQVKGAMAFFSWASRGQLGDYAADEAAIELDEEAIVDFLCKFATQTQAKRIHVIAHSMGNRLLLRAIDRIAADAGRRTGRRFGQFILAAPDVDARLFARLSAGYRAVTERTTLYVSMKDKAIEASGWLHDFPRAGLLPPVMIVEGIDTVNVTNADITRLGHGYVADCRAVLTDMHYVIHNAIPPQRRAGLRPAQDDLGRDYWLIGA